jgi:transposase-like protein
MEGSTMTADEREIRRKRRIFDHAVKSGNIAKTCRYFGVPRSLFYVWRNAYRERGEEGLLQPMNSTGWHWPAIL